MKTTEAGYRNRRDQEVVRQTGHEGNLPGQRLYILRCHRCGHEYGANGCDIHIRKCPQCMGGQPGPSPN
jgi:uncharacterized Zn finger protein